MEILIHSPHGVADAKGLLVGAIRDNDPVIFFEHKVMYDDEGPVPEGEYQVIWFDTWEGKNLKTVEVSSSNGSISIKVPGLSESQKDIAFKWVRINK